MPKKKKRNGHAKKSKSASKRPAPEEASATTETTETVKESTTLVGTGALNEKGIDQVRVLSESRFVELVRDLVEASVERHLEESKAMTVAAPSVEVPVHDPSIQQEQLSSAYETQWSELRSRHTEKLERIEHGVERLAGTFSDNPNDPREDRGARP